MDASHDPFAIASPEMRRNPYPTYARLRREAPVHFAEAWGGYMVTRYADVAALFRDKRLSAARAAAFARALPAELAERLRPLTDNLSSWALLVDPPVHTRLRGLITKAFTPMVVERLRPAIEELSRTLLDDALASGSTRFDVVASLANPLPVIVIGDLLGLPRDDRHLLKKWSDAFASFLGAPKPSLDRIEAARAATLDMEDYFRAALRARRQSRGDDLLSTLLGAELDGKLLSEQELLSTCSMLLFGGHETTTNLIANGLHSLLEHPEELATLRAHPEQMEAAVEELLRYDSPVQRMGRIAAEELDLADVTIPAGSRVFLMMGAAHRDPDAFVDADRLHIGRTDNRHLALGLGHHYCVGAALGRLEAQIALGELLRRFSRITSAEPEPVFFDNATIRGLERLSVDVA